MKCPTCPEQIIEPLPAIVHGIAYCDDCASLHEEA